MREYLLHENILQVTGESALGGCTNGSVGATGLDNFARVRAASPRRPEKKDLRQPHVFVG